MTHPMYPPPPRPQRSWWRETNVRSRCRQRCLCCPSWQLTTAHWQGPLRGVREGWAGCAGHARHPAGPGRRHNAGTQHPYLVVSKQEGMGSRQGVSAGS